MQWEDEMAGERTGYPTLYSEAKKMRLLKLHTAAASPASREDCSFIRNTVSCICGPCIKKSDHSFIK